MWIVILAAVFLASAAALVYAYRKENLAVEKVMVTVRSGKIKGRLTILLLSDLHLYRGMQPERLVHILTAVRKAVVSCRPDIIILAGDLIDNNSGIPVLANVLSLLKAPSGVYAVLGNHDYYQYRFVHVFSPLLDFIDKKPADTGRLKVILKRFHVKLLVDHTVRKTVRGNPLTLAGIDALTVKEKKWGKIQSRSFGKGRGFNIVLSHYPDVIRHLPGGADLVLSGHTHGGQITFFGLPLITRSAAGRKSISGVSVHGRTVMHVSKGLGVGRNVPFRFFAKPDFSVIRLEGQQ